MQQESSSWFQDLVQAVVAKVVFEAYFGLLRFEPGLTPWEREELRRLYWRIKARLDHVLSYLLVSPDQASHQISARTGSIEYNVKPRNA